MKYTMLYATLIITINAQRFTQTLAATNTNDGYACIAPTIGPRGPPDPSMTWPSFITSGPAHPSNTVATPTGKATPSCSHATDPDGKQGYCPEIGIPGWCECDGDDYPLLPGEDPCAYTKLPASTTALKVEPCSPSTKPQATAITTKNCVLPGVCFEIGADRM